MSDPDDEKAGPQVVPDAPADAPPTPEPVNKESARRRDVEHSDDSDSDSVDRG